MTDASSLDQELIFAMRSLQPDLLKELIQKGANPYAQHGKDSALSTWLEVRRISPWSVQMLTDLLSAAPTNDQETQELLKVGQAQMKKMAYALGVRDHALHVGVSEGFAYLDLPFNRVQKEWETIHDAMFKSQNQAPTFKAEDYAAHFIKGMSEAEQLMRVQDSEHVMVLAADPEEPSPQRIFELSEKIKANFGEDLTVLSNGLISNVQSITASQNIAHVTQDQVVPTTVDDFLASSAVRDQSLADRCRLRREHQSPVLRQSMPHSVLPK